MAASGYTPERSVCEQDRRGSTRKAPYAKQGFNFVHALRTARNRYVHWSENNGFTNDEVYSLADSATRLLRVVRARKTAEATEEIRNQYFEILKSERIDESAVERASESSAEANTAGVDGDGDSGAAAELNVESPAASRGSPSEEAREELLVDRLGLADLPRLYVALSGLLVSLLLVGGILCVSRPYSQVDLSGAI